MRSESAARASSVTGPNAPAPVPAPGTANVWLCNFIGKATTFKITGAQGGAPVTKDIRVPANSYVWSTGWEAGEDKIVSVTTPYFTKGFSPFVTSDIVAIFES